VLLGSYLRVLCIFALWPLYLYVITNRTHHRGADRGPGVPGDPGALQRTTRFTPISALISYRHRMLDLLSLYLNIEMNLHDLFIYLLLDHLLYQLIWLRDLVVLNICLSGIL